LEKVDKFDVSIPTEERIASFPGSDWLTLLLDFCWSSLARSLEYLSFLSHRISQNSFLIAPIHFNFRFNIMAPPGSRRDGSLSPFIQAGFPSPFGQEMANMSRPMTSIGIPSRMTDGEDPQQIQERRSTLDPATMKTMRIPRPETPVSGIPHSMIRKIKQRYDTGAKIVDAIKQGIEIKTGGYLNDEETNRIVDTLLSSEVIPSSVTNFSL
jgi:hypothetical protein